MRWLTFAILAACAICFQTTWAASFSIYGIGFDLVFILLVHYALQSSTPDGLIAAWLLGLLVDLASVERLGLVALAYGLAALGIWSIRDLVFRHHPLTHFMVTFLFCLLSQLLLRSYSMAFHSSAFLGFSIVLQSSASAVLTGLGAVVVHHLLLKISRVLGLADSKRRPFSGKHGLSIV